MVKNNCDKLKWNSFFKKDDVSIRFEKTKKEEL